MVNTAFKLTTNAFMLIEYINRSYLSRADDNQDSSMNNKYFGGGLGVGGLVVDSWACGSKK